MSTRRSRNWPIFVMLAAAAVLLSVGMWSGQDHWMLLAIAALVWAVVVVLLDVSDYLHDLTHRDGGDR